MNTRLASGTLKVAAGQGDCLICGGVLRAKPEVRLRSAWLCSCPGCGSWTYFPRPTRAQQASLHDTDEYFEHPYFQLRRGVTPEQRRRCRELFRRVRAAVDLPPLAGERLLDVGCDTGGFLLAAREEFGIVPVGVDVARRSVSAAWREGIEAYCTILEEAPPGLSDFRMITAIDVVEHVTDPRALLREMRRRLRPGGVAYLETPNIRSALYRCGRVLAATGAKRLAGTLERLFPAQHLHYFTRESFTRLARSAGFAVAAIETRVLPAPDIAVSRAAQIPIQLLQTIDRLAGTETLITAVLRRPLKDGNRS